jgi:hypothetical protein
MSKNGTDQPSSPVGEVVNIQNDGAAIIQAETVNLQEGGAAIIKGQTINLSEGGGLIVAGQTVKIQEGGGAIVLAKQAELKDSTVMFLASPAVTGEANVMFDLKAAILFGAIVGLVVGALNYLLRR